MGSAPPSVGGVGTKRTCRPTHLLRHEEGRDRYAPGRRADASALVAAKDETISLLRSQLEAERTANAENRRLLAAALERIPAELEAPRGPRDGHETATAGPDRQERRPATDGAQEGAETRRSSWWRR